jgi:hypothetical protein
MVVLIGNKNKQIITSLLLRCKHLGQFGVKDLMVAGRLSATSPRYDEKSALWAIRCYPCHYYKSQSIYHSCHKLQLLN